MVKMVDQLRKKFEGAVIYKITNPNGRIYIGQTINFERRIKDYKKGNFKTVIGKSIKKYGFEKHKFEFLEKGNFTKEDLDKKEIYWIKFFNSYHQGMNMTLGGDCGTIGYKHTLETKQKFSEARKKIGNVHPNTIKIFQYDLDFNFLKEWESISAAEKNLSKGNHSNGSLGRFLSEKKVFKSRGFIWSNIKFLSPPNLLEYFPEKIKKKKKVNYIRKNTIANASVVIFKKKNNTEESFSTLTSFCKKYNQKINYLFDMLNGFPAKKSCFTIEFYSKENSFMILREKSTKK